MKEKRRFRLPNPMILRRAYTALDYLRPVRWNWSALAKPLDSHISTAVEGSLLPLHIRVLRYFWLDGLFATISENFYIGFAVMFALAYGATSTKVGSITAIANLFAMIAFYPGAFIGRRKSFQKTVVLLFGGGLGRISILLMALIPLLTNNPGQAILLIIIFNASKSFWSSLSNPAWTAITADIVPNRYRGRYFSGRNFVMIAAALVAAPAAGAMVHNINRLFGSLTAGFQYTFLTAFIVGIISTISFGRIKVADASVRKDRTDEKTDAGLPRKVFIWFLVSTFIWSLSVQIAGPFFQVYLVKELGGDISYVGYSAGFSSLAALGGQLIFGRIMDKKGNLKGTLLTGFLIPIIPILWMFFAKPWHAFIGSLVGGFLWAGYNLANFNLLLEYTSGAMREKRVALYQSLVFMSAVVGPAIGGYLIRVFQYKAIFLCSGIGRLAGVALLAASVGLHFFRKKDDYDSKYV